MDEGPEQFQVVPAGRRSFKTERKKRKLIMGTPYHEGALTSSGKNFFFGAPTREQAKKIAWKDLLDMTYPFWSEQPNKTELIIYLNTGSTIHVLGMDRPERAEGVQWHGGVLDEYGNMKEETWPEHIQPVTADTGAWIDFIGVPEGRNHYFDLANKAKDPGNKRWGFYTWKSADILPPDVIEEAMRSLDERTYRQEYEASFENYSGLAYYAFSENNYTNEIYTPNRPAILCWDFNAGEKPMACIMLQESGDKINAVKEFVFKISHTEDVCRAIESFFEESGQPASITITGDYAGHRRESSASFSDYHIIEHHFKNYPGFTVATRPTLSVRDRVAATNTLLCNGANEHKLFLNPETCPKLKIDFQRVEWSESGMRLDERQAERTHPTDAVSYYAYNFHPLQDHAEVNYS